MSLVLGGRPLLARPQGRWRDAPAPGAGRTCSPGAAGLEAAGLLLRPAALNPAASESRRAGRAHTLCLRDGAASPPPPGPRAAESLWGPTCLSWGLEVTAAPEWKPPSETPLSVQRVTQAKGCPVPS